MKNFIQPGEVLDFTAAADLVSGQAVMVGTKLVVALGDYKTGVAAEGATEGVFDIPKVAGAVTLGQALYWDVVALKLTTTTNSGANPYVGWAFLAAASGDATVRAKLSES